MTGPILLCIACGLLVGFWQLRLFYYYIYILYCKCFTFYFLQHPDAAKSKRAVMGGQGDSGTSNSSESIARSNIANRFAQLDDGLGR